MTDPAEDIVEAEPELPVTNPHLGNTLFAVYLCPYADCGVENFIFPPQGQAHVDALKKLGNRKPLLANCGTCKKQFKVERTLVEPVQSGNGSKKPDKIITASR